ncbi:MAG: hypothetical protein QOF07_2655 [Bradyrhizobium sp.]|jgi:hypothetical protein|nr:hypothetical protein [Bradyrhizobium sp.]
MSTTDHTKGNGKPGQRNRKIAPRGKPDAQPSPKAEKALKAQPAAAVAQTKTASNGTSAPAAASPQPAATPPQAAPVSAASPAAAAQISGAAPSDAAPVSLQTIATAYGDCTRKSLEEVRSFVEKLIGARSLDNAIAIQSEFAQHTFQNFVADTQKIYGLYGQLAKQTFKPFGGFVAKATQTAR